VNYPLGETTGVEILTGVSGGPFDTNTWIPDIRPPRDNDGQIPDIRISGYPDNNSRIPNIRPPGYPDNNDYDSMMNPMCHRDALYVLNKLKTIGLDIGHLYIYIYIYVYYKYKYI
jgi:hypothetical protein